MDFSSAVALRSEATGLLDLPVLFPASYAVKQYIVLESARHDSRQFVALHNFSRRLSKLHKRHALDTAAGTWKKMETLERKRCF